MISNFLPQDQVFWYLHKESIKPLCNDIETDVVIVGGGMSGLSAAQAFQEKGFHVTVIEKNFCGSGASGKSSGFITPDSELSLRDLTEEYGAIEAKKLWDFIVQGVKIIENNILKFNIDCDYQKQDTLILANSSGSFKNDIKVEYSAREKLDYKGLLYEKDQLNKIIGSDKYYGGTSYSETFGINGYRYCYAMKEILKSTGIEIYEETPAIKIENNLVTTPNAKIKAKYIVVCADHFIPKLNLLKDKIYHAQTFLMISTQLSDKQVKQIFPEQKFMVWDTDLVYQYYRIAGDNRLLLGGASLLYTYAKNEIHNSRYMSKNLTKYFDKKFPGSNIQFEYIWPGLIGISKDLFPITGFDTKLNSVYYVCAAAGLPWAATLGNYSAERIVNNYSEFDKYLSPYRSFKIEGVTQKILGTKLSFALSNFLTVKSI